MQKKFDIPGFTYFAEKNNYTGSVGNIFNYKITNGEKLAVDIWKGKFCLAKTPKEDYIVNGEFEKTPEGLEEMKKWLNEQHELFESKSE